MSRQDRETWDRKHSASLPARVTRPPPPPPLFAHIERLFPTDGKVLEIACGRGEGAVWLASRGLGYHGLDISPVAIEMARGLITIYGLDDRCNLEVWDLDDGLPPGDPVDLLFCHMFRDPGLYEAMGDRVAPGGLLAIATLSEVDSEPGRFRARPGELHDLFGHLEVLYEGEGEGMTWILARKPVL